MRILKMTAVAWTIACLCLNPLFPVTVFAGDKEVILAHEISWAPFYGKDLKGGGYTVEIVREAFGRVGYKLTTAWLPWKRAQVEAARGDFDGLGASYYTPGRATQFACSDVVAETDVVFFKRVGEDIHYNHLMDLKPYKIGIGLGYGYPEAFEKADYLQKVKAYDIKTNITRLLHKRVDLIIGSKKAILFCLKQNFPDKLNSMEVLGSPLETLPLFVLFSKNKVGYEQTMADFNRGLKIIREDGAYRKIIEDYGLNTQ